MGECKRTPPFSFCKRTPDGARRGAGQRRPGAAGGVLPGLDGHARPAGMGLRHPLPVRHVPAAHHRRLPARAARLLAQLWQPVGDRAPVRLLPRQVLRPCVGPRGRRAAGVPLESRRDGESSAAPPPNTHPMRVPRSWVRQDACVQIAGGDMPACGAPAALLQRSIVHHGSA